MPYAFNDDKSKYTIDSLISRFDNLFVSGVSGDVIKVAHGGTGNKEGKAPKLLGGYSMGEVGTLWLPTGQGDTISVSAGPGMNCNTSYIAGVGGDFIGIEQRIKAYFSKNPDYSSSDYPYSNSGRQDYVTFEWIDSNAPIHQIYVNALIVKSDGSNYIDPNGGAVVIAL